MHLSWHILNFTRELKEFVVMTDASATGIGAVLEQGGRVLAYISRALSKSEQNYSIIQKECLAIIFATKQLHHYLLGRSFKLLTDHAPLQAQKMEGMLCHWALALQEFDFKVSYRPSSRNGNADALSRVPVGATSVETSVANHNQLKADQQQDPIVFALYQAMVSGNKKQLIPKTCSTLRRYLQLWSQLTIIDGVVYRRYTPDPVLDPVTVPILPALDGHKPFKECHDAPSAGHLSPPKTLAKLRREAYWAKNVFKYCKECTKCQQGKPPMPQKAPLTNIPIGPPWQMVAVDIMEVPLSRHNNRYLLVLQDYFTKWVEVIPLPRQTADLITAEIVKLFTVFGIPDVLHSDQGRNFESSLLRQTLEAFGVSKSRTTAYHPQGDGMVERFNRSLLQMLRAYVELQEDWRSTCH